MRAARHQHVEQVCTRPDVARFHFLDETGLRLTYARTYGRAVGGRRVGGAVPLRRGPSLTLIGTLCVRGLGAVQLLNGALTQRSFALYVAHCLAPTLRPGGMLVLDNLAVHKIGGLRKWLAQRGVQVLFLSPYSPDFSPTEQAWSKLKTKLRTCTACSCEALKAALYEAIDWISSQDARNWFDHCGYSGFLTSILFLVVLNIGNQCLVGSIRIFSSRNRYTILNLPEERSNRSRNRYK